MAMQCAGCGKRWDVTPKPDGTMPVTTRCPKTRGGCGKLRKVPRSAHAAPAAPRSVALVAWEPPSTPRVGQETAEECPECGTPGLLATPRNTARFCRQCKRLITPARVAAPYERGTGSTREARSQRERDDDAKRTVIVAGEFLRRVEALAADPKIHPESADLLGWYAEEITKARTARSGQRLAELAAEWDADTAAGEFRRRRWWQGQPAAIEAGADDDGWADGDWDDEDQADDDGPGTAVVLATPASIAAQQHNAQKLRRATWAEALGGLRWQMYKAPVVGCAVMDQHGLCGDVNTTHPITGGWACGMHYAALCATLAAINQERGIT